MPSRDDRKDRRVFSIRMRAEHQRLLDVHVLQQGISRNGLVNRLLLRELRQAGLLAEGDQ